MQKPWTYDIRRIAHSILLNNGPMSLNDLAGVIGYPKEALRYAIESTFPFEALFRKNVGKETIYEAVPIEKIYGEEDFY